MFFFTSHCCDLAPEIVQLASIHTLLKEPLRPASVYSCKKLIRRTPQGTPGATLLKETDMDAKYNWLIDNGAVRVTLNTVAFALWVALAMGILELAAKSS